VGAFYLSDQKVAFFLTRYHHEIIVVNHMRTIIIERLEGLSNLNMVRVEHFHNLVYYTYSLQ
jgi:hypothetical protein